MGNTIIFSLFRVVVLIHLVCRYCLIKDKDVIYQQGPHCNRIAVQYASEAVWRDNVLVSPM